MGLGGGVINSHDQYCCKDVEILVTSLNPCSVALDPLTCVLFMMSWPISRTHLSQFFIFLFFIIACFVTI